MNTRAATGQSRAQALARKVLELEAAAIAGLLGQISDSFDDAVELLARTSGRIVCTGMGKSGHVMRKLAATLASTGSPALFLHPAEAIHGDLGMIVKGDVVLAASFSGTTQELLRMLPALEKRSIPLVAITGNPESPLALHAAIHLPAVIDQEACPLNLAPTASTTATLALGDALAMALLDARGFTIEDFASLHPGGNLGRRLLKVEEIMHQDDAVPVVNTATSLRDTIYEMSRKGLGVAGVVDDKNVLIGVISDGDLRRLLQSDEDRLLDQSAGDCMRPSPRTIDGEALAPAALERMEDHRITALFVCDESGHLEGIVHIHDLWGLELA